MQGYVLCIRQEQYSWLISTQYSIILLVIEVTSYLLEWLHVDIKYVPEVFQVSVFRPQQILHNGQSVVIHFIWGKKFNNHSYQDTSLSRALLFRDIPGYELKHLSEDTPIYTTVSESQSLYFNVLVPNYNQECHTRILSGKTHNRFLAYSLDPCL